MANNNCFGGFGFGAWAGHEGRRLRWKVFDRGDLKFVILRLVSRKPMHGYEVMQALEEESGGCYKASPGSVYPTLQMLEDQGLLHSREENGKKVYEITEEGRDYLDRNRDLVDEIFDRIESFAHRFLGKETRDLSAAFSRLAQSAFEGAFAWEGGPESVARMAEVLDRARKELDEMRQEHRRGGADHESDLDSAAETPPADAGEDP